MLTNVTDNGLWRNSVSAKKEVVDMAQTDMDKKEYTKNTVFSKLKPAAAKCEHLKPLSVYSGVTTRDQQDSLHQFCNPFINFKIEIMNNCVKKRKLDNSDGSYETPAKKAFSPKVFSPDLGCFMDYSSPPARQDAMSPFAISKPALLKKTQAVRSETEQTVCSAHVECGSSTEPGDNEGTVPHNLCEKIINAALAFDCDVDSILCLNPIGTSTARGLSDNGDSCKSASSTIQSKPVLSSTVADGKEFERGDGKVVEEQEKRKKELYLNVKDTEEDKGYSSMFYAKDLKTGKDPSQSPCPYPPLATSSPLFRLGEVEVPKDECHTESSLEQSCPKQAAQSGQTFSHTVSELCPVVSGPQLDFGKCPAEPLEGDIEEMWDIGLPIFESSVCHSVTVKLNTSNEQNRQVSEEGQRGMMEPIHESQATFGGEEATLDTSYETSYETTLPLQVQVKSVVVALKQNPFSSNPAAPSLPKQNAKPTKPSSKESRETQPVKYSSSAWSQREVDLERDKRMYLHSVTRHLNENPGADQDVMTELLNLMTHVADQRPGTNGRQWQHPSDLTRRNYQRRFGNMMPALALHEWHAKNTPTHKRFSKVPKIFQRSQFP